VFVPRWRSGGYPWFPRLTTVDWATTF
jgi:hypothetical protein